MRPTISLTRLGRLLVAGGLGVLWTAGPLARPGSADPVAGDVVVSAEVYTTSTNCSNTAELRDATDALDIEWRSLVAADRYVVGEMGLDTEADPTPNPTSITFGALDLVVDVSKYDVSPDVAESTDPESWGVVDLASPADPALARSETLQDCAPRPSRAYASEADDRPVQWNATAGDGDSLDAVLFEFDSPISAFGAWFGDVETRTDGEGRPALVKLFDADGNVLTVEALTPDRAAPLVDDPSGRRECGGRQDSDALACGNQATRFIGFATAEPVVVRMMVIVGDDDSCADGGECDGSSEHLSFVAPQVAVFDTPPTTSTSRSAETTVPSSTTSPPTTVSTAPVSTVPVLMVPSSTAAPTTVVPTTVVPTTAVVVSTVQGSTIPVSTAAPTTATPTTAVTPTTATSTANAPTTTTAPATATSVLPLVPLVQSTTTASVPGLFLPASDLDPIDAGELVDGAPVDGAPVDATAPIAIEVAPASTVVAGLSAGAAPDELPLTGSSSTLSITLGLGLISCGTVLMSASRRSGATPAS